MTYFILIAWDECDKRYIPALQKEYLHRLPMANKVNKCKANPRY